MRKIIGLVPLAALIACSAADVGERGAAHKSEALTTAPALSSFVLLARQSAAFSDRSLVSGGNLGVAAASGGAQNSLSAGPDAHLGIGFDLLAQRVVLGERSVVGNLDATTVVVGTGATTGTRSPFVAPPAVPTPTAATTGGANVTVQPGQVVTLAGGRFNTLVVNGTLNLSGGVYEARSLVVNNDARVVAQQRSIVRLSTGLSALDRARILTASGLASDLTIEASGTVALNSPLGVSFGNDGQLTGLVIASRGVQAGDRLLAKGAIAAQSVTLGHDTSLSFQGGFACATDADCGGGSSCAPSCIDAQCQRPAACTAVAIAPGSDHACAVLGDGTASCWGDNGPGDAGHGDVDATGHAAFPQRVAPGRVVTDLTGTPLSGVRGVDVGAEESCAVLNDGSVWCWGSIPGNSASNVAVQIAGVSGATAISVGTGMACALLASGDATCFTNNTPPTPVGLVGATAINTSSGYACALLANRTVQCWGDDFAGTLGDGTRGPTQPAPGSVVPGVSNVVAITTSDHFVCALLANDNVSHGGALCWGTNDGGELGDGSTPAGQVVGPTAVSGLSGAVAIGSALNNACAVLASGATECWGQNFFGQLGDGDTTPLFAPSPAHPVSGLTGAVAVGGGTNFTCAVVRDGRAFCWGTDTDANLGDGSGVLPDKSTPVQVQF